MKVFEQLENLIYTAAILFILFFLIIAGIKEHSAEVNSSSANISHDQKHSVRIEQTAE